MNALLDFFLVLLFLDMANKENMFDKSLIFAFDLRQLHFMLIPVAARFVLIPVFIEGIDSRFKTPYSFE